MSNSTPNQTLATEDQIREALAQVIDPEIGLDIVNLGLIYGVLRDEASGKVTVQHTLTSPGCPLGPIIQGQIHAALTKLPGIKEIKVDLLWDPPWDPHAMCSEEAKMELGIF